MSDASSCLRCIFSQGSPIAQVGNTRWVVLWRLTATRVDSPGPFRVLVPCSLSISLPLSLALILFFFLNVSLSLSIKTGCGLEFQRTDGKPSLFQRP